MCRSNPQTVAHTGKNIICQFVGTIETLCEDCLKTHTGDVGCVNCGRKRADVKQIKKNTNPLGVRGNEECFVFIMVTGFILIRNFRWNVSADRAYFCFRKNFFGRHVKKFEF